MRLPWVRRPTNISKDSSPQDVQNANEALEAARKDLADTEETVKSVKGRVRWLRFQREQNHFAPAVAEMLREHR